MKLDYAILANPAAGRMTRLHSREKLSLLSATLSCPVFGLDTQSVSEFQALAATLSRRADVLIIAGGDGSFVDAINNLEGNPVLAFLPLGSGNALGKALSLPEFGHGYIDFIRRKKWESIGLLRVNESRKCFFAGLGVDALTIKLLETRTSSSHNVFKYSFSLAAALARYRPGPWKSGVKIGLTTSGRPWG